MNLSLAMQGAKNQLVQQLIYFDEEKIHFLDHYFPDYNQKRIAVERKLSAYATWLEDILQRFDETLLHQKALIGSKLEIEFMDDADCETFTIVFPPHANPDENKVSFLSPIGFQLLLTNEQDQCRLQLPSGEMMVKVNAIRYVNQGEVN